MATSKKKSKTKPAKPAAKGKKPASKKAPTKKLAAKVKAKVKRATPTKSTSNKVASTAKKVVRSVVDKVAKIKDTVAAKAKTSKSPSRSSDEFSNLVTPLDDRVLVLVEGESDRTTGGLYIPGTVAERPTRGRVVAVGRGARNKKGQLRPLDVVVGDAVLFAESAGTKLTLAGKDLLLMRESDLLGVVG